MGRNIARGFLDDILANPDDDAPRLAYSDWLQENGDESRSEFIRVQVARARLPDWDAAQVGLRLREAALIKQHGEKWKDELPTLRGVTWGGFRRGFVAEATLVGFETVRSRIEECCNLAPLQAVKVGWPRAEDGCEAVPPVPGLRELSLSGDTAYPGDIARLAAAPLLSTLRVLDVSKCELEEDGFRRLVLSPHLRGLRALRAAGNSVGNEGVKALRAARLDSLEELDLSEGPGDAGYDNGYGNYAEDPVIDVDGVGLLTEWPGLARLRSLKLSGNNLRRDALRALLRSPRVAGLKELVLRSAGVPGDVGRDFYDAESGLRLDVLDLSGNMLGGDVYDYFGRAASLSELKVLNLSRCELGVADSRRVVEGLFVGGLRVLDLSHDTLGADGLAALLAQKPASLHTLKLRDADVGDDGAECLAASPASDVLVEVGLEDNRLGARGAAALAETKHLRSLLILRLADNPVPRQTGGVLARSGLGKRLAALELDDWEEQA